MIMITSEKNIYLEVKNAFFKKNNLYHITPGWGNVLQLLGLNDTSYSIKIFI